ncbi:YadA-like family protein, partial [Acinetobacter brisouii]|uniref:YadA-like family protein n=1 Tax=Acinetobacter brisouii TaxID=396323 RepID=UPI001D181C8E
SATKAKSTVSQGDNIVVTSSSNADGSTNYQVATAKDLTVDSVTAGNSVLNTAGLAINDGTGNITNVTATGTNVTDGSNTTNYGADGFAIAGGPSVSSTGINAGNTKITNLAAGTSDSDAVNVSQINKLLGIDINNAGGTGGSSSGYKIDGYDAVNTESEQTDLNGVKVSASQDNTTTQSVSAAIQALNTEVTKLQETNLGTKYFRVNSTEDDSLATGENSIAIGTQSKAIGNQSIAIGVGNTVNGNNSGAIGDPTTINGNNSYSVGNDNTINTDDTFVLGNNVTQTTTGSVVLGANSAATTAAGEIGYASSLASSADLAAINATTSTTGAVAVGDASTGLYRQITGVAAGTQDSDAVNVAQLKAVDNAVSSVNTSLNQAGTSIANILGGGSVFNTDGSMSNPTYTVAGTTQTTVEGALNALDQAITSATSTANAGWTLSANGTTQQIKPNSTVKFTGDQNVSVALDTSTTGEGNVTVSLNKDLTVDSVTTGNTVVNNTGVSVGSNVAVTSAGLVISGGPSVTTAGINAGGTTITNVAAGVNATDAVNKSQLDAVAASAQATDNSAVKYDDSSTKSSIKLGGANGTTISNVAAGAVTATSTDAVNGSQLYNVQQQVDQNTTDISDLQQSVANVANGKSGLVQQASITDTITVGKDTGGTSVSVAGTDGNRTVTGVKAGSITATSTDAVNGTQLYTSNQNVATYLGGGSVLDANGYVSAPTYSVAGGSYNNVGDALTAVDTRVANVEQALEQGFMATNNRINKLEDKLSAGIAATAALENAPYVPGKFTYAAGASAYNGQSAVGATLRRTADNGRWSMSGGVAASSQGDPLFRIGISGVID